MLTFLTATRTFNNSPTLWLSRRGDLSGGAPKDFFLKFEYSERKIAFLSTP